MEKEHQQETILVVDDTPATIEIVKMALEEEGYKVLVATNGEKALKRAALTTPALILLDIMMPDMDGHAVCLRLKADEATAGIPVIFMSALTNTFDKVKGFTVGAVDYVVKPVEPEELLARVRTHLTISRLQRVLEYANAHLEERVLARIEDLRQANARLQEEISERTQAEARLQRALGNKTILIQELYHRTKNTMAVIQSMLLLQAAKSPDNAGVQQLVRDTDNRIQAIALVHEKLYQSQDLSRIDIQEYISELAPLIGQSCGISSQNISLSLDVEPVAVLLDTALPCGLVLTELLSNALKYAFPGEHEGEITISLFRNDSGDLELVFADNGVGVPPEFDFNAQTTFGLTTITALVEHQMQGTIAFENAQGVRCAITFPDTLYTERV
ncbi:MAG: response regulator [bacterium]|nr:response regulator [bacterium]